MTTQEIDDICNYKNISREDFVKAVLNDKYYENVLETLEQKQSLYVGKAIPILKDDLEKNKEFLLKLSKEFAVFYSRKYSIKDIDEIKARALEIFMNKCGDTVYNLESNRKLMENCLIIKCEKYLSVYRHMYFIEYLTDYQDEVNIRHFTRDNKYDEETEKREGLDLSDWNLNLDEEELLYKVSRELEDGYDMVETLDIISERDKINKNQLLKAIESIRLKNLKLIEEKENKKLNNIGEER